MCAYAHQIAFSFANLIYPSVSLCVHTHTYRAFFWVFSPYSFVDLYHRCNGVVGIIRFYIFFLLLRYWFQHIHIWKWKQDASSLFWFIHNKHSIVLMCLNMTTIRIGKPTCAHTHTHAFDMWNEFSSFVCIRNAKNKTHRLQIEFHSISKLDLAQPVKYRSTHTHQKKFKS